MFAVICNGAEIVVQPERPDGIRSVKMRASGYQNGGTYHRKGYECELDDIVTVGRQVRHFTRINESSPLHWGRATKIYVPVDARLSS